MVTVQPCVKTTKVQITQSRQGAKGANELYLDEKTLTTDNTDKTDKNQDFSLISVISVSSVVKRVFAALR